jgi:hypothetical protein
MLIISWRTLDNVTRTSRIRIEKELQICRSVEVKRTNDNYQSAAFRTNQPTKHTVKNLSFLKRTILWDVMSYSPVKVQWIFQRNVLPPPSGSKNKPSKYPTKGSASNSLSNLSVKYMCNTPVYPVSKHPELSFNWQIFQQNLPFS